MDDHYQVPGGNCDTDFSRRGRDLDLSIFLFLKAWSSFKFLSEGKGDLCSSPFIFLP